MTAANTARGGWIRALARTTPAPVRWDRVILTAIGIAMPVGVALLLAPHNSAMLGAGALASMGAMIVSTMDTGAPGIQRVHRMMWAALAGFLGVALGTLIYGHPIQTFIVVVIATLLSGLSGEVSATASRCGLYFLMYVVTAANAEFGLSAAWHAPLVFLAGAAWRVCLTAVAVAVMGTQLSPERRAVAGVYRALAEQLSAPAGAAADRAGAALTTALNGAYDTLTAARTDIAARDARWQRLVALLDASAPVSDAVVAMGEKGAVAGAETVAFLRETAAWIDNPSAASRPSVRTSAVPGGDTAGAAEQYAALDAALARVGRALAVDAAQIRGEFAGADGLALPRKPSLIALVRGAMLSPGSEVWSAVLRLVLCMAVAQGITLVLKLDHPYLVMLAVAKIMKPDFGSVFARAVQRGIGTVFGVAFAALAITMIPRSGFQLIVVVILAAAIPITMPRNFGLYSVVNTALVVLLVELHIGPNSSLVESRLLGTVLGCAIVLLVGYLPWPSTWHAPRNVPAKISMLVRSLSLYVTVAITPGEAAPPAGANGHSGLLPPEQERIRMAARRAAFRAVSDVRTLIGRSVAEPPVIRAAAEAWLPELHALERVADAVTAIAVTRGAADPEIVQHDIDSIQAALGDLADEITTGRMPAANPVPVNGPLAVVGDELTSARRALAALRSDATRRAHSR